MGTQTSITLFTSRLAEDASPKEICRSLNRALKIEFPRAQVSNCTLIIITSSASSLKECHATFDVSPGKAGLWLVKHWEQVAQHLPAQVKLHRYHTRNPLRIDPDSNQLHLPPDGIDRRRKGLKFETLKRPTKDSKTRINPFLQVLGLRKFSKAT